ncbi:MAG: hypothetical protein WCC22_06960 [Terriglobales bacterium]
MRVLFIGNSYTYFNDLCRLVSELSVSAHETRPVEAEMEVSGGATLKSHWDGGKALKALRRGGWDYVVLQEQSTLEGSTVMDGIPQVNDPATFKSYARLFDVEIKKADAKTVFFLTWARQNDPNSLRALVDAYVSIAQELGAIVAPVGIAWRNALQRDPNLELFQRDKAHPTAIGSYLTACVFYATFYGKTPEGLTARIWGYPIDIEGNVLHNEVEGLFPSQIKVDLVNLDKSQATLLQRVAWQTVQAARTSSSHETPHIVPQNAVQCTPNQAFAVITAACFRRSQHRRWDGNQLEPPCTDPYALVIGAKHPALH